METMENHGMDAEFNFESALEDYLSTDFGDLEEGTIVKGEIVRVDDDNVLVDVNFTNDKLYKLITVNEIKEIK